MQHTHHPRTGPGVLVVGVVVVVGTVLGVIGGAQATGLITGRQIKDGTVTRADVRDSTVTGIDVRHAGLTPDDYDGDVRGAQGPRGDQGAPGRPGTRMVGFAVSPTTDIGGGRVNGAEAVCDPGVNAIGGGVTIVGDAPLTVLDSSPGGNPQPRDGASWAVRMQNPGSTTASYYAWAICAEVR